MSDGAFVFRPIGVVRTPFSEKQEAPRQASVAALAEATVELFAGQGFEDALSGLEGFSHVWLIFAFDRAASDPSVRKVLPPRRASGKVGVFATRSPHRPNPVGMSAVELLSVEGLVLRVRGVDLLDGTPLLDLKPYMAYCDAVVGASAGWVGKDPEPPWPVRWEPPALERAEWLAERGIDLRAELDARLSLGPQPHAYRRIRVEGDTSRIAWKEWRARFRTEGRAIVVLTIASGYRASELSSGAAPAVHRDFAVRFGG